MTKFQLQGLSPIYAVIFLSFLGYALTITLFIPMLMDPSNLLLPANSTTSMRVSVSGFLLAMYPLGQFLGSPIIGHLSDYYGRKRVLLMSLLVCSIGFMAIAISISYHLLTLLFISAFITGLSESNMAIAQTVIADKFQDPIIKTKYIGYAYSACSLGYIVGPLLGGSSGMLISHSSPFFITSIATISLAIWLSYSFNDSYTPNKTTPIKLLQSITAIKSIFNNSKFFKFYAINFLIFFSVQGLYRAVPLYLVDTWKPSLHTYSLLIAFVSFICLLANMFLLAKVSTWVSLRKLLSALLLGGGVLVIVIVIPNQFHWIWLTYGIAVIPTVMALPLCTTWLSQHASDAEQGQVLGNNQALLVLGEASSAAVSGLIAAIMVPLPIILMGGILIITGIWFYSTR